MVQRKPDEWMPVDLLVVELLRQVVTSAEDGEGIGATLSPAQVSLLRTVIRGADREVAVGHPDELFGPAIYEGPGSRAHLELIHGTYRARALDGNGAFLVVVGASPWSLTHTASAVFSTAGLDASTLDRISDVLANVNEYSTVSRLLQAISDTVESSGRPGLPDHVPPAPVTAAALALRRARLESRLGEPTPLRLVRDEQRAAPGREA